MTEKIRTDVVQTSAPYFLSFFRNTQIKSKDSVRVGLIEFGNHPLGDRKFDLRI